MNISRIITALLLGFVGLMFVVNFVPQLETSVSSANVTNTFVASMIDMAEWVVPVGGIVGLFYGIFTLFKGRAGSKA